MTDDPLTRSFLVLDVERYRARDNVQRQTVREDFYAVLHRALEDAGIKAEERTVEDRGDGVLAVFDRPVWDVLDDVVDGLIKHLANINTTKKPSDWLRLRFAVNSGFVHQDSHGWSGAALDETFVLNGLPPVKDILRSADRAQSVLVVSNEVYRNVVQQRVRNLDPAVYQQVEDNGQIGWAMVPGYPAPPQPNRSAPARKPGATHTVPRELATLRARADDLTAAEAGAKTAYDKAFDKIANPKLRPLAIKAPMLLDRIDTLERRALNGQPLPVTELSALSKELIKADETTRQCREQATALVDQRDQLRKRLECYYAMAGELRLELAEIDKRYSEARTLLWTKPCRLDAATRAVDAYQQSVIAERDKRR